MHVPHAPQPVSARRPHGRFDTSVLKTALLDFTLTADAVPLTAHAFHKLRASWRCFSVRPEEAFQAEMRRLVATSTRRPHAPGAEWAPPPTFAVPPELDVFTERPVDLRKGADLRELRISRVELDLRARFVWQPARRVLTPRGVINLDPSPQPRPLPPPPPPQPQPQPPRHQPTPPPPENPPPEQKPVRRIRWTTRRQTRPAPLPEEEPPPKPPPPPLPMPFLNSNSAPISRVIGWMARAVVGATGRAGMCISST